MSFRRRPYLEILDNLLTAVTGGVAAEPYAFPPPGVSGPPYWQSLQKPVAKVVSVYGSKNGATYIFQENTDYKLENDQQTLTWLGPEYPDPGTLVLINYYPTDSQSTLTDIYTGSVIRTLVESIALEIARLHAQLEVVYQSGFIDTATGRALDNVVALLGIKRIKGGKAAGEVEFTRSAGVRGVINIPAGIRVMTADAAVMYETLESATMNEGQTTIRVKARDLEDNEGLAADSLTVLAVPIAGIASVTNPAPSTITTQEETDAALRTRAKNFLHGSERATLGAIRQAIAWQGIKAEVEEVAETPGLVKVTPQEESLSPEMQQRLLTAIEHSRPAGVRVQLEGVQPPRKVNLELRLTTMSGLLEKDLRAAQQAVRDNIKAYFSRLPAKEPGSLNRLTTLVLSIPEVQDVQILSATWTVNGATAEVLDREAGQLNIAGYPTVLGELRLIDSNLPTLFQVLVKYPPEADPPDPPAIQKAVNDTLAYLNELNAKEVVEVEKRTLTYQKLLFVVPLPEKAGGSLADYYKKVDAGAPLPALPETADPYQVQFTFITQTGLSHHLTQATDKPYVLSPFERLSGKGVEITSP